MEDKGKDKEPAVLGALAGVLTAAAVWSAIMCGAAMASGNGEAETAGTASAAQEAAMAAGTGAQDAASYASQACAASASGHEWAAVSVTDGLELDRCTGCGELRIVSHSHTWEFAGEAEDGYVCLSCPVCGCNEAALGLEL